MTSFSLNVGKVNETINDFVAKKKTVVNDVDSLYDNLKNIDNSWNDTNSLKMIEIVKMDKKNISDFVYQLNCIVSIINDFKNDIYNVCYNEGYKNSKLKLVFDDSQISRCVDKLNSAIDYLADAYSYLGYVDDIDDFRYTYIVRQLKNEIQKQKRIIDSLVDNIQNFISEINEIIDNYNFKLKKYEDLNLNIKKVDYHWKIQSFALDPLDIKINK
jgi:hypothetical protein